MQADLDKANKSLDRLKIVKRGSKLSIRGTFPPKPGHGTKPKQYFIATGADANKQGLILAKAKAKQLEVDLVYERFSWEDKSQQEQVTVERAIAEFEAHYWNKKKKTVNRQVNYKNDYQRIFLYLPQDEILTAELLTDALKTTEPDSRNRQQYAIAYAALAKFANLEVDFSELKGNYHSQKKLNIPTEAEIEAYYNSIPNPAWQWVFGIIATFGIRPHEVFHLENLSRLSEFPPILKIGEETKTKSRLVYPIPANDIWVKKFKLREPIYPKTKTAGKSNKELGQKVGQAFRRYKLPIAYDFRDAYAIRGAIYNFNPVYVAKWMGHSLDMHEKEYLCHMEESHFTEAWLKQNEIN